MQLFCTSQRARVSRLDVFQWCFVGQKLTDIPRIRDLLRMQTFWTGKKGSAGTVPWPVSVKNSLMMGALDRRLA